ncbi:BEL1-like homeodomain protein 4 [Canna indica]|uniref:BEL1-like homeodomain protein 4 n=1 Tax=Canna indica TaxID=4628 RepID=A0AAQ3Q159_9LILI|nr:BEL1-like homeodomain protein 4 [Canna indica]
MGIATQPSQLTFSYLSPPKAPPRSQAGPNSPTSMSQGFHQGLFSFSEGFDRSATREVQQPHIAQQSRRDKLRVQGFDAAGHPLLPIEEQEEPGIYESTSVGAGNMLSDMFNFQAPGMAALDLHANQISAGSFQHLPSRAATMTGFSGDWYGANRQGNHHQQQQQHSVAGLNTDSAAAMQLFLMNPPLQPPPQQQPRSPSPPPPSASLHQQAFQSFGDAPFGGRVVEGQGLSLSLSSSLQQLDMAKADELRVREGVLYFNNQHQNHQQQTPLHLQGHVQGGQVHGHGHQLQMGYGGMGVVNVLRSSKYTKAAQELLEEFCSVGRGQLKGNRIGKQRGGSSTSNRNPSSGGGGGGGGGGGASSSAAASTSSSKEVPPLSPADRFEHQRKKAKLVSMLDEVDRRYNHYCDQMQMVVNSFDSVMGFGAATPYTALAQKAMSRHFRCLKDAIAAQLKQTCELLGEKDGAGGSGITKGDTPRLRVLDQSLRQQRAFNQMGMMEQEAWRPQRGLPERSVNILRGWLFEHFLHPYPSDADKHMLARQTGLSRNQVSNWFINARVRLWKPMVEEMYVQESKDEDDDDGREKSETNQQRGAQSPTQQQQQQQQQPQLGQRAETNAPSESDASPSTSSIGRRHHRLASSSENPPSGLVAAHHSSSGGNDTLLADAFGAPNVGHIGDLYRYSAAAPQAAAGVRFGATGDVSLTLGLRHAGGGSSSEKSRFSVRDFSSR